jgi:hypothetical protein
MNVNSLLLPQPQVILNRMREKARRAIAAAREPNRLVQVDGGAVAPGSIKQEENDEFTVFAGRTKVFRPGATSSPVPPPAHGIVELSPAKAHAQAQVHAGHGPGPQSQSMLGEWLARQEQYVGYDPHYVAPMETHPSTVVPQHQHQQYGYTPPEPQYALEPVQPPLPQYMATSYHYTPPPQGPPLTPQALGGPPPHHPHPHQHPQAQALPHHPHSHHQQHQPRQEDLELRRTYAAAFAPSELSHLGLAANGSRVSDTWMSFMHTGMLDGGGGGAGPSGRPM